MSYTRTELGKLPGGQPVSRYTLTNGNGVSASFTDLGAIWLTMNVPDKEGHLADVVLGADRVEVLLENPGHMGEPVGRNANRIGGAAFVLNGKTYALAKNNGENNLHSGPDYYRTRLWEAQVEETGLGTRISFGLESPDGDQGFPGHARVTVSYTLTEDDSLQIDYHMVCDEDTVANMTNHAYFNLAGHASGDAMGQLVWIDGDHFTPTDAGSIPTGELQPVEGTPMDFRTRKPLAQEIDADFEQLKLAGGYDHNWALNHPSGEVALSAKAWDPESGRTMEVYTDLPGVQLYTANGMNTADGKGGAFYGPRSGYCFETQYFPDAVNKPQFASPVLKAGEEYRTVTIYKFGVE